MSNANMTSAAPRRSQIFELAARAGLDPRTARKVLERGISALRGVADRERAAEALRELGIEVPHVVARDDGGDLVTMRDR